MTKYCVLYLKDRSQPWKESKSPWFSTSDRAHLAFQILERRYGKGNAIIYID